MVVLRLIGAKNIVPIVLVCFLLVACAAKDVTPISISNASDGEMTCTDIRSEIVANEQTALKLAGEEASVRTGNTAAVAASFIVWPALFALDLSESEKIQAAALRDRNQYLEGRYQNNCGGPQT